MKPYNLEDAFSREELIKSICDFFGLAKCEIQSVSLEKPADSKEDKILIVMTLKDPKTGCPHCHSERTVVHAWTERTINYSLHSGRKIDIVLKLRRYRCKDCRKTFMQYNPFAIKQGRIAVEMIVNILRDLQNPSSTFTSVGKRYNLSATTVMNIFDTRVNMTRLPLGEYVCLDENYAFRSDRSKYVCVLVDFLTQDVIDILPNRFKTDLTHYFRGIPMEERAKVKAVGIDMYPVYRDVIKECFPSSTKVVVDRFHLVKEFNSQMDMIRKTNYRRAERKAAELKKGIDKLKEKTDFKSAAVQLEYKSLNLQREEQMKKIYLLKKFNWLLYKSPADKIFDENNEKKYNARLTLYLNYADIRRSLLSLDPSLKEAYRLREELTDFFSCRSSEEGSKAFDTLKETMAKSHVPEIRHFARTFQRWKTEILNSLEIIDSFPEVQQDGCVKNRDRHLHNGVIERRNKEIKVLKSVSCGYTNFARMRQRILYTLRNDPSFSVEEAYERKTIHRKKDETANKT